MGKRNINRYVDGTAAVQMPRFVETPDEAAIIEFPTSRGNRAETRQPKQSRQNPRANRMRRAGQRFLDSSEMYCSLRYEDFHGCPYNLFTPEGIALLSGASSIVACIALVLGA